MPKPITITSEQRAHLVEWIAALRSGKYTQARGRLRSGLGYCCLGVACDISGKGEWIQVGYTRFTYGDSTVELPSYVEAYYGLWYGVEQRLVNMNDRDQDSFLEIADYIESLLPTVQ